MKHHQSLHRDKDTRDKSHVQKEVPNSRKLPDHAIT